MSAQLDFFREPAAPDPLQGLAVHLSSHCRRCGAVVARIAEGAGPHAASLCCATCAAHRGWLAHDAHSFLTKILTTFGSPTAPVTIRRRGARRRPRHA
jgi:hypothetical protein